MKTKILTAVIITTTIALSAREADETGIYGNSYGAGTQQVVVNNYFSDSGYEYASRLKRFHNSYISFDFYSPLYTEVYWYNYRPYTWGVSIYDDWHYYGNGVSRYSWTSGYGGSYWWGYDPWMDYDPWMGFGWNSWYSPGLSVNIFLDRPQYHYPVAWNRWNHHHHWDNYRPVYVVNNNNNYYYNSNTQSRSDRTYYPSRPASVDRRSGYTIINGRSSGTTGNNQAQDAYRNNDNRSNQGNQGNQDNRGNQGNNAGNADKDKSNNGLRVGQYRRGVAEPTDPKPNEPVRPNNPNVNDRTDPGRERDASRGTGADTRGKSDNTGTETPAGPVFRRKPGTVTNQENTTRTTGQTQTRETRASGQKSSSKQEQPAARKSETRSSSGSTTSKSSVNESESKSSSSGSRRK